MGWRNKWLSRRSIKEQLISVCSGQEAQLPDSREPTRYKFYHPRSIITRWTLAGLLTFGSIFYAHNNLPKLLSDSQNYLNTSPKTSFAQTTKITDHNMNLIENKLPIVQTVQASLEETTFTRTHKYNPVNRDKTRIIRADILEEAGTTIRGTINLKYTNQGISVPNQNYVVISGGGEYSPDEDNHIKVPQSVLNQKRVRLAKLDPDTGKPLASFSTKIKMEGSEQQPVNYATTENRKITPDQEKQESTAKKLETICQESPIEESTPRSIDTLINTDSPYFASLSLSPFEIEDTLYRYSVSRRGIKGLGSTVSIVLNLGYKFNAPIDSSRTNDNGYMRSDTIVVKKLIFERGKTFAERAIELKEMRYSNKKIAEIMRAETKKYFVNGEGININERQISDSLASRGWIYRDTYEKNPWEYQALDIPLVVYGKDGSKDILTPTKQTITPSSLIAR